VSFAATDGFEGCTGSVRIAVPHSRKSSAGDGGQSYVSTGP
jgi:hypothetical protein